ncbi:homocysteine S-methyltransferase [Bacillus thuringiensis]|uniref:S-methylmethionine:homocysteine methyltransferase n=2 Tax=Bacillus thuringiensis TaxID=1428 RepID=A0ABD5HRS5_BACTU|nr:homocysteine S-methyltransferase [Bacillus thuringiensis]MCR6783877.1 homocysteine S-methyltransferase [Bacillus thuringiensis]MCR6861849.1 homocysteine S-methyltransferase [Bacillus thuringiensis]MCR6868711.1 homocysteine S-methyltransferase [Bacillus thuringiensis]MDW9207206.1 homocysteine S-methyltransferase [Bacillus thuringiensis serovar toumanoffi]MDW9207661.1 homocysteine S-methyltransferase [Bacillus thuringiensis serovar toumanoffi]
MSNKINPIDTILSQHSIMLLDGALATELEAHGCNLDDPLWSARVLLENPELIYQVHSDYFRAGADCAITASYQATISGFSARGIQEQEALELIKKTVLLARRARDDFWKENTQTNRPKPLVVASVGPYGAYLADGSEYVGNYVVTDKTLADFHRSRMSALIEAGADLLAFETIPCLQEARVLDTLLREFPETYAWLSFSLKNEKEISEGMKLVECARVFEKSEQIVAIGINCAPVTVVTGAIQELRANIKKPIIVYPNSGETYNPETKTWHGHEQCNTLDIQSEEWYQAGARLIGGCCRTTPYHIEEISNKWRSSEFFYSNEAKQ